MDYYQAKQYDSLLINMNKVLELRPNHPTMLYNLAVSYVLNNKNDEAFKILHKMAKMGLFYQVEKDQDFDAVLNNDEFKIILNELKENSLPTNNSSIQLEYPEKDLITESVALDPETGTFYLSSIHKRKIVKIDANGKTEDFKSEMEDGLWSVFGIKIDHKHRLLYACTSPMPQMINYNKEDDGKGALLKYDLDSGKLLKIYSLDNKGTSHIFGDLAIDKLGNVYVSDSKENSVYRLSYLTDEISQIIKPGKFVSLQGLDLDGSNNNLYLVDYALGLYRFNFNSGKLIYIEPSEYFVPQGMDGLYFYNNSLITTQNGVNPQRVIRIYLNDEQDKVASWKTLEANNSLFDEITLGVLHNNNFYFIANSQWNSFNKDGSIFPMDKLKKPVVLRIKL
jgi:sugar lactone lactonase YvrE